MNLQSLNLPAEYVIGILSIIVMAFAGGFAVGITIAADRTLAALKGGEK